MIRWASASDDRARICERLRSPGIDSASLCTLYSTIAWQAGISNRVVVPAPRQAGNRFLGSLQGLYIRALIRDHESACNCRKYIYLYENVHQIEWKCLNISSHLWFFSHFAVVAWGQFWEMIERVPPIRQQFFRLTFNFPPIRTRASQKNPWGPTI
jgi:hypothetical protein